MKYSCADFTFPLLTHDKVLNLIQLLGIEAVDLGIFEDRSHHYPSKIALNPEKEAETMRTQLDRYNLDVADVFVQTGAEPPVAAANNPDPNVRQNNREIYAAMIRYARKLGATHITGLPGVLHEGIATQEDWKLAVDESKWRLDACHAAGITYAIEAHVGSILPDPQSTLRFLEAVPGLTLTLDYGHFIYQGMSNEESHCLIPHASHFHARGGANGALQTTVKDNTIDFPEILKRLKAVNYSGYLCLEYVWVDWEGCNRTDNVSETLLLKQLLEDSS